MKPVLILDAGQRSALAVTRSLGRHGIPVQTGEAAPGALAGCSRYSDKFHVYPHPAIEPGEFVEAISRIVREEQPDLLLPMTELTSLLLLQHRDSLGEVLLPFPDTDTVERLANKCELVRLARKLRVPVPRTWIADSPDHLPEPLDALPYPLVIKPGKSWLQLGGKWQRAGVHIAASPDEASAILGNEPALRAHPFLLQEFVEGHGAGVFALYDHGQANCFFAHRRVREKPPEGGVSVVSESVVMDPGRLAHSRALLDAAGWHGIAMVEFRVSPNGTPWLMEVNTRFWGSLQLAVDAGMDFPWLLCASARGETTGDCGNYRAGRRLRWLLGDIDRLYLVLRDARYTSLQKAGALAQFLRPSPFRTRHEVNRWHDPVPAWCELKSWLRDLL